MKLKKLAAGFACVAGVIIVGILSFLGRPEFGDLPSGQRLESIQASPHWQNGQFQNLEDAPVMTPVEGEDTNRIAATWKFLFGDKTGLVPPAPMVSEKTDLNQEIESWW